MDQKNLPNSAKIIEIFEAQLKSIKKLDDTIIKGKIDPACIKRVEEFVAPVSKLLKDLSDIAKLTDFINNNSSFLFNIKFKIKFKILMRNIESIASCIESFSKKTKAQKKDFENLNNATKAIKETLTVLKDLIKDVSLVGIMLLNPLIYLSLPLIILFLIEVRLIARAVNKAASIKFAVFGKSKRKAIKDSLDTIYEVAKQVSIVAVMLINPLVWLGFPLIKVFITKIKWLLIYLGRIRVSIKSLIKIKLLTMVAKDMVAMIGWFALASIAVVLLLPILVVTMPIFLLTLFLICKGLSFVGKVSLKALLAIVVISLVAVAIGGLAISLALAALLVSLIDFKALLLFVVMLVPLVLALMLFGVAMASGGLLIIAACMMLTIIGLSLLIATGTLALVSAILNKANLTGLGELVTNSIITPMSEIVNAIQDNIDFVAALKAMAKMMVIVSISFSVLLVATILRGISNLKFVAEIDEATGKPKRYEQFAEKDFSGATSNCVTIVNSLAQIATEIDNKVNFKAALKASVKIMQLVVIAAAVSRIAKILSNMAKLEVPEEIDPKTGDVIKWRLMDKGDFEKASQNIGTIITTLLEAITNDDISKRLDDLSGKSIRKIRKLLKSVSHVKNVLDAIQMAAKMIVPDEIDPKTGNIIKYKLLTDEDIQLATENIATIMTTFLMAMTNPELEAQIDDMSKRSIEKISQIMETASYVKDLFDAIEKSSQFDETAVGNSMENIQKLVATYVNTLKALFIEKSHLEWYYKNWHDWGWNEVFDSKAIINEDDISSILESVNNFNEIIKPVNEIITEIVNSANKADEKLVDKINLMSTLMSNYVSGVIGDDENNKGIVITPDAYKKINLINAIITSQQRIEKLNEGKLEKNTNNFIKFIDKANSIDVEKIKTVTEMFGQIAEFSASIKGDFDKLADVLSEKLVDILEKIHGAITDINDGGNGKTNNTESNNTDNGGVNNDGMVKPDNKNKDDKKEKVDLTGIENELNEILSELQNLTNRRW